MMPDTDSDRDPAPDAEAESDLRIVDSPGSVDDPVRDGPVAGILLAAGTSSRYGDANKLLASVDGDPIVRQAGRTLADAELAPRVAVLGWDAERVRDALGGLGFTFVSNPDFERGQATSVRAGVEALGDSGADAVSGAVVALGDMPFVDPETVAALVAAYRAGRGAALAAACDGRRGNPVLFDARYFDALADLSGDVGGREILLDGDEAVLVETGDPGVHRDIDVRDDLPGNR